MSNMKQRVKISALLIAMLSVLNTFSAAAAAEVNTYDYTAVPGDTFFILARRFDTTAADIAARNPGVNAQNLAVGTRLRIAAGRSVVVHVVRPGETLWTISVQNNTPMDVIAKHNKLNNLNLLFAGQVLAIPRLRYMPGEFDRQASIWLQWPSDVYNSGSKPVYPVTVRLIKAMAPYEKVNLAVRSEAQIAAVKNLLNTDGFKDTNVSYHVVDHYSIWARDVGPVFLKDQFGMHYVPDFGFNNYGRGGSTYYIATENSVDRQIAGQLGLPVIKTALVSEGGAVESNGRGTIMLVEAVALPRNPGMTKLQIENEYKRVLGASKVIWLKQGLKEDERITGGHINEFARFADPHTILLAQVLPVDANASAIARESSRRMEENNRILQAATDQDGKPLRIVRIPIPPTLYTEANATGHSPVYSYLNYAAINGAVILPTYWKTERSDTLKATEQQVEATFRRVFPGRDIIGVDAESVNLLWGGGIHCMTQHMPAY